jgi:hypothetical protein
VDYAMRVNKLVGFQEFRSKIKLSINTDSRICEKRYRKYVGLIFTIYKEAKWGKRVNKYDEVLRSWIAEVEESYGQDWKDVWNLNSKKIQLLRDRQTTATICAISIHYRLHAELECPRYAEKLDRYIFGKNYKNVWYKSPEKGDEYRLISLFL